LYRGRREKGKEIVTAITPTERLGNYLEIFTDFEKRTAGQPGWLRSLRQEAFARFCQTGFPTTRDEDWRFTNVSAISQKSFHAAEESASRISANELRRFRMPAATCQLVFVNGRFAAALSDSSALPSGIRVGSLAEELASNPGALEPHLGRYINFHRDAFSALNTAFMEDGAYVYLPKRAVLEAPIHLLFVSAGEGSPAMAHPHTLIVAEDESQAGIVEDYVSFGSGAFFSNVVTELVAGENAVISHYLVEREDLEALNVSTLRLQQARSANVSSHSVLLGGALVRNNVHPVLAGEGGECLINGLFIGNGRQHMDNYMLVEHASPHCSSRQFYNGILDGNSHGVFHGRIIVHKDAQKTDAKQTNRNLLLSDNAQIDTKPQLEIYADDVKCTHGATIGQIEENALFYMRSRGIDESSARRLLLFAFANESLERMRTSGVREYLEDVIRQWLPEGKPKEGPADGPGERNWEEVG
jgi:Fe-S cluster assembly protein SufD